MFSKSKAITLAELVTVIAIAGIITGIAMLSMAVLPTRRLQGEARRIVTDLAWVREMASSTHSDYCVRFESSAYEVYRGTCSSGTFLSRDSLQVSITSPSTPFNVNYSGFNSNDLGGVVDNDRTITLNQAGRTKDVYVYAQTGYAQMEE